MRRDRGMALAAVSLALAATAFVLFRPRYEYVWKGMEALPETVNAPGREDYEPNVTPDGKFLIFTRGKAGQNADLFIAPFAAGRAGDAAPISSINTEYDEVDGMLTHDGQLYFYSDRPGGLGGYDLYAAPRLPNGGFGTPVNLGPSVNSSFNDYDPCVTRDGRLLYFSSNRHSGGSEEDYDLYVCYKREGAWSAPKALEALNSPHNEWEPMLDRTGGTLYLTSNRPREDADGATRSDYDLFAATLGKSGWSEPRNLGASINSTDDEFDPCVSPKDGALLYVRGMRSESAYDVDIWKGGQYAIPLGPLLAPGRIPPQLVKALALLAAALLLFLLLVYGWNRLSTLQKCLVGSVAVHCLVGWLSTLTTMTAEFDELGQKEATFVIYTDLPEDLDQDAFVAALFESAVDVKASEAPQRALDVPEPLPATLAEDDVREITRPETSVELAAWMLDPAELTPLARLPDDSRDVSQPIDSPPPASPSVPQAAAQPTPIAAAVAPAPEHAEGTSIEASPQSPSAPALRQTVELQRPKAAAPAPLTSLTAPANDTPQEALTAETDSRAPLLPARPAGNVATPDLPVAPAAAGQTVAASAATTPAPAPAGQPVRLAPPTAVAAAPLSMAAPAGDTPQEALAVETAAKAPSLPAGPAGTVAAPDLPAAPAAPGLTVVASSATPPATAPAGQPVRLAPPAAVASTQPLTELQAAASGAIAAAALPQPDRAPRIPTAARPSRDPIAAVAPLAPALPRSPAVVAAAFRPAPRVSPGRAPRLADRERLAKAVWGEARNLGSAVNSEDEDYEPNLGPDGKTLYFTRGAAGGNANLYVSSLKDGEWTPPNAITNLNSEADEIDAHVGASGTNMLFYSDRPGGVGGYDLYASCQREGAWQSPTNLGSTVNSEYNEYDPALRFDGRLLLFSSNRHSAGSEEDYDLYQCMLKDDGSWSVPVRLPINTGVNEWEPALSADGQSLYFASNRPGGEGGYDLWVSLFRNERWQAPVNLGPGVNSEHDELDAVVSADGGTLFFATNRNGGHGSFDLWRAKRTLTVRE